MFDNNKIVLGGGILTLCLTGCGYLYQFIKSKTKYKEFGQDIKPLNIEINDILNTNYKDREYMPFRYPYHQTMALVKLDMNHWGIVDNEYHKFMTEKAIAFSNYDIEKLEDSIFYNKEEGNLKSDAVFKEFGEFVVDHYTHRFPKLFGRCGKIIYNRLMNETYNLETDDPFLIATRISMEDFYLVTKDENLDKHKCIGVSVAFGGGGFPITPIVGQSMDDVHKKVPYYESKLKKSMNKWFDKFVEPFERASWHIVWDRDLQCSELYSKSRELSEEEYLEYIKTVPLEKFDVRIERQTLIKLPKTQAIVFANHPLYLNLLEDLADIPMVPSILLKMMYESPSEIIKYKHYDILRETLTKPLEKLVERQVELGYIAGVDLPVKTVPNYPFK
jgi:hypothetical protein